MSVVDRFKKSFNLFQKPEVDNYRQTYEHFGPSYSTRPNRVRLHYSNERSIISSIYTRLSIDISVLDIRHVRNDKEGSYEEDIKSALNDCLTVEANIDQASRAFMQDVAMTLFDEGVAVIVPIDTSDDPDATGSYDIFSMQVGRVIEWKPRHVRVSVYDDVKGIRREILMPKSSVAIVENPLFAVMNETQSTLKRLTRKLNLLDAADEASSSGKLDLIIQLPYVIKNETKQAQADQRKEAIEMQLRGSKYGIAYTDATEKITQLNRPAENNLLVQIQDLTKSLYVELGLTESIFNGEASETAMLNYHNRTIEPIMTAITQAMVRAFLTKTARTQGQSISFFRDPFKLVPISQFADIADKLNRNEVVSGNETRGFLGIKPSKDPKANMLRNSNMPHPDEVVGGAAAPTAGAEAPEVDDELMNSLDATDAAMDEAISEVTGLLNGS